MAILITGGMGFIGRHLAERLIEAEQEVVIFDIDMETHKDASVEGAILIQGDISNVQLLEDSCEKYKFHTIFHLASILPPKTEEDPYYTFKINLEGTMNVLKAAVKYNVKNIIYTSSATVFGPDRTPPFTEEDLRDPWTVYSSYKICNEIIGSIYSKKFDLNFRAVRFPVVLGPGRVRFSGMTNYPIEMLEDAIHGKPYVANVSPDTKIPIIYVEDAVQVLINLWRIENIHFEIYDIDGLWVSANEIAEGIKKYIPSAEITFKPVEDASVNKVLNGVKEEKEKDRFGMRGKRLLDEILQEYISRSEDE
ncbi:MAG TPA: NAD-dependent epimerase/dehydratase family protein [candidate division Zixibacteria bacterium]|nr:NAD-dependent epimerase/dehydratase family protein [candidate division Zixibacteria bacterium]